MKNFMILISMLLIGTAILPGQNSGEIRRPFKIKVVNKKGKPYKDAKSFLFLSSSKEPFLLDRKGTCTLNVAPDDTVYIAFANYRGSIPVNGMDSVMLTVDKNKLYAASPATRDATVNRGYEVVKRTENNIPFSSVDLEKMRGMESYNNLADFLIGRFAGVNVVDGQVTIRGQTSVSGVDITPLIIIDGVTSSWSAAQNINLNDIKSVDVNKDGLGYGQRGANGVIIITTKTGK